MSTRKAPPLRYQIKSAADAMQAQPPIDWIIDKLFSVGSLSLVVGAPGSKKTYSMLSAGVCVALGKPWLGMTVKQSDVLIIDEESGERRLARRLSEVIRGELGDEKTPLRYVSLAGFNLQEPKHVEELKTLIAVCQAKFIVIDALADIMPGADENLVRDVIPVFLALRKVADETHSAIALIHHNNKQGNYRGSTAISGAVDLLLQVDSKQSTSTVDFSTIKARDIEPFRFAGESHFGNGEFWLSLTTPAQKTASKIPAAYTLVLQVLKDKGIASRSTLKQAAAGASPSFSGGTIDNAINDLSQDGFIYRTNPNQSGRGVEALYAMKTKPDFDDIDP